MHPHTESFRSFNRFYARQIGLLRKGYLDSPFSLTEVRILYELAHRDAPTATELSKELGIDAGYLSRTLLRFRKRGLIQRKPSSDDRRQAHLSLTKRGRQAFAPLETESQAQIAAMLGKLSAPEQNRLVGAMHTIEKLLGAKSGRTAPYLLRPHRPGDMGWVIHRHGAIYAREYGWDERFEALVAEIAAKFIQNFDPGRERCWIAEKDGEIAGSVFLVKQSEMVAKLRLLLVEPSARGAVRLPDDYAVDAKYPAGRGANLPEGWVRVSKRTTTRRFRHFHGGPDLGNRAITRVNSWLSAAA